MARTNVPVFVPPVYTHEGAKASKINAVEQLRRSVLACLLFEDQFYESGDSIATRIKDEVQDVLKLTNGADIVANLAVEARSKFKLRHAPLHLVNALVQANTEQTRAVVSGALYHAIQRPDELNEFLSQYWADGKKPIPNQVKKGLAAAFGKFNEYSLGKYANRDGAVSLRDVLFLVHPKPQDEAQAELWKRLADNELKAPENTWEVQLSAGGDKKEVFTKLIESSSLGILALLRNLRNMTQAGVDDNLIRNALATVSAEKALPFRFITAAKYAPKFEPELEAAMFRCLDGSPKLKSKTILVVDNSGSMYGSPISTKSELQRTDAACALAMLLREVCEEVQIIAFAGQPTLVAPRRGFALRDLIQKTERGGTYTQNALNRAAAEGYDRIIVLTDEQSHQTISAPLPGTKGYFLNVASAKNGIGYGPWTHLDGFSESLVEYILAAENQD